MESGIPVLTAKGCDALRTTPPGMSALSRNILVQVDGKKSIDDILRMFRGLKGLDEAIQDLLASDFMQVCHQCRELVRMLAEQMLGPKSATLIKKIDDLHARYGEQCWDHMDEIDKVARMFYGEVTADRIRVEISMIIRKTRT